MHTGNKQTVSWAGPALDEPFDEQWTMVRTRPAATPVVEEQGAEEPAVEWFGTDEEARLEDVELPAWEDLTGLRRLPLEPPASCGRQQTIDLIEEQQRRQSPHPSELPVSPVSRFPPAPPLPRFALNPGMVGIIGAGRRAATNRVPSSFAPVAANGGVTRVGHPWLAAVIGSLISAAASFAFLWSPTTSSHPGASPVHTVGVPVEVPTHHLEEIEVTAGADGLASHSGAAQRPFDPHLARQLGALAASDALACGTDNLPLEARVTFDPDGSVASVHLGDEHALHASNLDCVERPFLTLRLPPFEGEARTINVSLQ